jgi:hypothetical protein
MKLSILIPTFLLAAVSAFGAVPDYKAFRGIGGITVVSNPPNGTIVIDGSGISAGALPSYGLTNEQTGAINIQATTRFGGTTTNAGQMYLPGVGSSAVVILNSASRLIASPDISTTELLQLDGGNVLTNVSAGNILYVDAINGNETTGTRGREDKPFLAITTAVALAQSGDLVRVRPGTYAVTPKIVNSGVGLGAINILNRTNITIAGMGDPALTVIDGSSGLGEVFWITNSSGIGIYNMTIKGMMLTNYVLFPSNYQWAGISIYASEKIRIQGNWIKDHFNHGIWDAAAQSGWHTASTNQIEIVGNRIENTGSSRTNWVLETDGTAVAPTGWLVEGNWFEANWRAVEPYDETDGRVFRNCVIRNNFIHNTLEKAITTAGSTNGHNLMIEGNHIWNDRLYSRRGTNTYAQAAGIYVNAGLGHAIRQNTIQGYPGSGIIVGGGRIFDVAITDNYVDNTTNGGTAIGIVIGDEAGVAPPVTRFQLSGNRVRKADVTAIYVTGAEHGWVSQNIISEPTIFGANMGISIGTRTTNVTVSGNEVRDGTGTMQDGIVIHANSHNTIVAFNRFSGQTGSEISDSGVGTVTRTFGESLGSGSTNTPVMAVATLIQTNATLKGQTNITSNTAVLDMYGPDEVSYAPSGTFTLTLSNVVFGANTRVITKHIRVLTAQSGTFPATAASQPDWGRDGAPVFTSSVTNEFWITKTESNLVARSGQAYISGSGGVLLESNAPVMITATLRGTTSADVVTATNLVLMSTNGSHHYSKAVGSNAVNVTNIVGQVELTAAAVLILNANVSHRYSISRVTQPTTLVFTNTAFGQEISVTILGEASGGAARVITLVPQLGHLVSDLDTYGTALALTTSFTLTNGNAAEISWAIDRLNGTNIAKKVSQQFTF